MFFILFVVSIFFLAMHNFSSFTLHHFIICHYKWWTPLFVRFIKTAHRWLTRFFFKATLFYNRELENYLVIISINTNENELVGPLCWANSVLEFPNDLKYRLAFLYWKSSLLISWQYCHISNTLISANTVL